MEFFYGCLKPFIAGGIINFTVPALQDFVNSFFQQRWIICSHCQEYNRFLGVWSTTLFNNSAQSLICRPSHLYGKVFNLLEFCQFSMCGKPKPRGGALGIIERKYYSAEKSHLLFRLGTESINNLVYCVCGECKISLSPNSINSPFFIIAT